MKNISEEKGQLTEHYSERQKKMTEVSFKFLMIVVDRKVRRQKSVLQVRNASEETTGEELTVTSFAIPTVKR